MESVGFPWDYFWVNCHTHFDSSHCPGSGKLALWHVVQHMCHEPAKNKVCFYTHVTHVFALKRMKAVGVRGVQVPLWWYFRPFICVESGIIIPKCCQLEALGSSHLNSMCVPRSKESLMKARRSGSHSAPIFTSGRVWHCPVDGLINYTATTMALKGCKLRRKTT